MAVKAKRITQETFDDAVRENMDDFDMERKEAIADAISQFEMQGIDLSNIVTSTSNLNDGENPLVAAAKRLVEASKLEDGEGAAAARAEMELIFITLAQTPAEELTDGKVMVGNSGAVEAAIAVLDKHAGNSETVITACQFINMLTTKADVNKARLQEPKNDPRLPHVMIKVLDALADDAAATVAAWKLLKAAIIKSEAFKSGFMKSGGQRVINAVLETHGASAPIVLEVAGAMYSLMNADDLTTVFSTVFETAKELTKGGVLPLMYAALRAHGEDPKVLREVLAALKGCAVQDDIVKEILEQDGLPLALHVMQKHVEDTGVVSRGMLLLASLAENDDAKKALCQGVALSLIFTAMQMHCKDSVVVRCGCSAIAAMALRMPDNCDRMMEAGAGGLLVEAMRAHPGAAELQRQAMIAVRNIVVRRQNFCAPLLEEGVEELVVRARDTHARCADSAFDCLRDLGCEYGGLGDKAGRGEHSAYAGGESLLVSPEEQARRGSGMVTWEEED
jgi:hypothetical protein